MSETKYGPDAPVHGGRKVSGLEYMQAMARGEKPSSPFVASLGLRVVEAEFGRCVFECDIAEQHNNALGIAHGGLAAALIDSATGSAALTTQDAGGASTTLELKVNFVRPMTPKTGRVRCEGKIIHQGKRIATAEARLTDLQGKLYAHGSATLMLFQNQP
ncbi:MAG: PaaI family thioesterase [Alphaproteobacteria bacterium]